MDFLSSCLCKSHMEHANNLFQRDCGRTWSWKYLSYRSRSGCLLSVEAPATSSSAPHCQTCGAPPYFLCLWGNNTTHTMFQNSPSSMWNIITNIITYSFASSVKQQPRSVLGDCNVLKPLTKLKKCMVVILETKSTFYLTIGNRKNIYAL